MNDELRKNPSSAEDQFLTQTPLGRRLVSLRKSWGWFVGFGVLITLCGFFAAVLPFAATLASVFLLGSLLFAGGVFLIIGAFQVRQMKGLFWTWLLSGILFLVACYFAFAQPIATAYVVTILITVSLAASGVLRLISGFQSRGVMDNSGWMIASGIIGILAAVLIAMSLPVAVVFLPGFLLACDMVFQGVTMLMIGFALKKGQSR